MYQIMQQRRHARGAAAVFRHRRGWAVIDVRRRRVDVFESADDATEYARYIADSLVIRDVQRARAGGQDG